MTNGALTCKELVELMTEYLEGTLPLEERARFEAHLIGCEGCTHYLDQMRRTIRLTGMLTEESIEPAARDELLRLFRDWNSA